MLKKKYYDGFTVHDILNKHLDDGHKILELLTAFADANGVDAVEVVRCKDCKWYYRGGATCLYWDGENNMCGDDFCSQAKREEE